MKVLGMTKKILAAGFLAGCMMALSTSFTGCLTNDNKDTTATKKDTTPVATHTAFLKQDTVAVGAQGHPTLGTAVDLDAKNVMLSAVANANQDKIDVLFAFSGGMLEMMSPVAAKAAGDVGVAANYGSSIKDTQFAKVSSKPEDSEAAASTYAATPKVDEAMVIEGDQFLVKTGAGKLVYVKFTSIIGADKAASAELAIAISAL